MEVLQFLETISFLKERFEYRKFYDKIIDNWSCVV